jgi:hypothetical protein
MQSPGSPAAQWRGIECALGIGPHSAGALDEVARRLLLSPSPNRVASGITLGRRRGDDEHETADNDAKITRRGGPGASGAAAPCFIVKYERS